MTMRVLALDMEGGYGGSSRSLYYSLKNLPAGQAQVEVWCRKAGPIQDAYAQIGVPTRIEPNLRTFGAVTKVPHSLYDFARGAWRTLVADDGFMDRLAEAAKRVDLVHFNHEGLWLQAWALRRRSSIPLTMHVRKLLPHNWPARLQVAAISNSIDRLVYITEGEQAVFRDLGVRQAGQVIYNVAEPMAEPVAHPDIPQDDRFKVASIANYSWGRGVDRVVGVAEALRKIGRTDILFVFAGNLTLPAGLPGELGVLGKIGGGVKELAERRGVAEQCLFLGHVTNPGAVLAGTHALIKTARKDLPWGRDILEAMRAGRPVVTTGTTTTFVTSGETGLLMPELDADTAARTLAAWADDRAELGRLAANARERIARLCDGPSRAADLLDVWRQTLGERE